ncbi:MAG TPA: NapC/NirT family cytochrome c [Terriglobales bacterium]|nr:NapC/NirT family cytochrome c [Terriglobales bacterium]
MSAEQNESPAAPEQPQPTLTRNLVSIIGLAMAVVAAANIAFLVLLEALRPNPYIGIFAYMILPGIMVLGLLLIPVGMAVEQRRRRKLAPGEVPRFPRLDLNVPSQRSAVAFFFSFTAVFVSLSAVGSYRAYEFTDSVQFCGQLCHTIMSPEYTTYLNSPHARVACVDCHVGPGASWYVRSKLSGAYQVYAAIADVYPRPIPTPVANLRPAQQTCEQCHWPRKFYGAELKVFTHYSSDQKNTPRQIRMLIDIGGAEPSAGIPSGIHWHMNIANQITYIATDSQRQVIPWVQQKDRFGRITVYQTKDSHLTAQQVATASKRIMDCVDCHDRPSHIFLPPDAAVDNSLFAKRIDPTLPFVKQQAVAVLTTNYNSEPQALQAIASTLRGFYSSKYSQVYSSHGASVDAAIREVQNIYAANFFPEMKVDWRTHPNNIGHFYFAGCFRCHDGQHVSADGKVIPKTCSTCHTVLQQVESGGPVMGSMAGVQFQHPVDVGDLAQVNCSDCHTGGSGP